MLEKDPWLLPDGIEEVLPDDAKYLEDLRRKLLDVFAVWGYQLVIPPFIDYLNSLLTGAGHDLELQTFKLTDQLSGEMLGVRADMTPQVARIDAHNLRYEHPTRLCYEGTVLHTVGNPLERSRSPRQIGAELYGHAGWTSDLEVIQLMLEMLAITGLQNVHLDLGHVGIYRELSVQAGLTPQQESALFTLLQGKAKTELTELINSYTIAEPFKLMLLKLIELNGGADVLQKAAQVLTGANDKVKQALHDLQTIADKLAVLFPALPINFDLAELRGYHYHTGVVFAAFVPNLGREIARGGRYDNIGKTFGRARPATGFSADLKLLASLGKVCYQPEASTAIFAPCVEDNELMIKIRDLRAQGLTVIQQLPGQIGGASEMCCSAVLEKHNQNWLVKPLI
jgi:ATP phosphoribosyltransferase regulatory subunit